MESFVKDLRFAFRQLQKNLGSTALAVGTLALGIGATTAIVSVVDTLMLRELPYPEADRVVTIWQNNTRDGIERDDVAPGNYFDWKERNETFEAMGAADPYSMDLIGDGPPQVLVSAQVTDGFLQALGVRPIHGRLFEPEEFQQGAGRVVVISYGLWKRRFGGDPDLLGTSLNLDGTPHEVVGILPAFFELGILRRSREREAWRPLQLQGWERQTRGSAWWNVIARVKAGVTLDQARADMQRVSANLATEYPNTNTGIGTTIVPLHEHLVGSARPALLTLLGAAVLVLLIGCANVANLLIARGADREGEFAVRTALGARRGRMIRQLLTESVMLGLASGAAGVVLAFWGVDLIKALSPGDIVRMDQVVLDLRLLAFAFGLTLLTAIVFGLVPAIYYSRPDVGGSLKESRSSTGPLRQRLRQTLIAAETALALTLLVGAGLLLRSFTTVLDVDPGFEEGNLLALQIFAYWDDQTAEERALFFEESIDRIEALPEVVSAGAVEAAPFLASDMAIRINFTIEGEPVPNPDEQPQTYISAVTPGYFATMGIPLRAGQYLTERDRAGEPLAGVINESMAARFWPDVDPVGRFIRFVTVDTVVQIVGVVGNVLHGSLEHDPRPELFMSHSQRNTGSMTYFVRSSTDPVGLVATIQEEIWSMQPLQSFYQVGTVDDLISGTLAGRRFSMVLLISFAVIALVMAAVGLYGVIAFSVSRRTREVGIRMALGAAHGDVLSLVVREAVLVVTVGAVIGLMGAAAVSRVLASQLFGIAQRDAFTYIGAALVLLGVAAAACYLPARRATRVDPMAALRYE